MTSHPLACPNKYAERTEPNVLEKFFNNWTYSVAGQGAAKERKKKHPPWEPQWKPDSSPPQGTWKCGDRIDLVPSTS